MHAATVERDRQVQREVLGELPWDYRVNETEGGVDTPGGPATRLVRWFGSWPARVFPTE